MLDTAKMDGIGLIDQLKKHGEKVDSLVNWADVDQIDKLSVKSAEIEDVDFLVDRVPLAFLEFDRVAFERCCFPREVEASEFLNSSLNAVMAGKASFNEATFEAVDFVSCGLIKSSFIGSKFEGVKFVDCDLRRASFSKSELDSVSFEGCKFEASVFSDAQLSRVRVVGCEGSIIPVAKKASEISDPEMEIFHAQFPGLEVKFFS